MVERKLLWVFEIYSFLECIAGGKLMEKHNQLMAAIVENETDEQKGLRIEEAEFCRFNANLCIIRAIKVPLSSVSSPCSSLPPLRSWRHLS
jgi:hypothetical protein